MDRDPERINDMREAYARLNDDALFEQLIDESDQFEPVALELMAAELRSRGYTDAEIAQRRRRTAERLERGHAQDEDLVPLATFDDVTVATQVKETLRRHGIEAVLAGQDGVYPMSGGLSVGTSGATLLVLSGDLAAAEEVLAGFAPTAEGGGEEG